MIDWPDDLVFDIASRRSALFLGAGVSKGSENSKGERPKDWNEYLTHLASLVSENHRKEILTNIQNGDLLTACELARDSLKPDIFKQELLAEFSDKGFGPGQIHDYLSRVDSRFVLTSNFDKLYENRANQLQDNTVLVKCYYDEDIADVFRRSQRVVLKVHGTIDAPDRTIFTRSQYALTRRDYPYFYKLFEALFVTHTFVFLGTSLRDPDIRMILEDHAYRFEGTRPHFMVTPRDPTQSRVIALMEETMNLRALLYDPSNGHQELVDSLGQLVNLVETERAKLTATMNW